MKHVLQSSLMVMLFLSCAAMAQQTTTTTVEERENPGRESRAAKHRLVAGIKAGFNHSNVYDSEGRDFVADPKAGFAGGGYLAIPLGSFIGFQPELMISQKGFRGSGTVAGEHYSVTRTTTYLDVPLQLELKPFRFLSLLGGVQYSYLMKQSDNFTWGNNSVQQDQAFRNDNIRRNILGVVIGGDVNIRHVVLSARGSWDVIANHGDGTSDTPRYKNLLVQFTIGYRFY